MADASSPLPRPTLARIIAASKDLVERLPIGTRYQKIFANLGMCRSGKFGYVKMKCNREDCGAEHWVARGCGSRYCPDCGRARAEDWIRQRELKLLPTPYFQLVFTLPPDLYPLLRDNQALLLDLLLRVVKDTLLEFCDRHLEGAIPQILLALHTWNSRLDYHVHVHVLISAGGYHPGRDEWMAAKSQDYLFPVDNLGEVFRGKYLEALVELRDKGRLRFISDTNDALTHPGIWQDFKDALYRKAWFVYAERPMGGPTQVIRYLGQYLSRTAISNFRIQKFEDGRVTFECRDRKKRYSTTGHYTRTLPVKDFLLAFSRHILPRYFHRIRLGGLWSPKHAALHERAEAALLRTLEAPPPPEPPKPPKPLGLCPSCGMHSLVYDDVVVLHPKWRDFYRKPDPVATGPPWRAPYVAPP